MRILFFRAAGCLAIAALTACSRAPTVKANRVPISTVESGVLPASFYAGGARCEGVPRFLVHRYNANLFIMRQPACTNYEKPFLYLLFGTERALLLDTGAGGIDVAGAVDEIVQRWLREQRRTAIDLVIAHSHAHGDHVAGDSQFIGRAHVTLVGRDTASVRRFFGIASWPTDTGRIELGGRVIDVLAIPGHQAASIALYDRRTGLLLTGDSFYPGRLYVRDTAAFVRSTHRLVEFTASHQITHILGTHIENSNVSARDYPIGTVDQPSEHGLALDSRQLRTLDSALATMRGAVKRTVLADFTIWP